MTTEELIEELKKFPNQNVYISTDGDCYRVKGICADTIYRVNSGDQPVVVIVRWASGMIDYTVVLGVDRKHLDQLKMVWPTWVSHKRESVVNKPLVVFFDREQIDQHELTALFAMHPDFSCVPWPPPDVAYEEDGSDRFHQPQRTKMLSGFIHVAANMVATPYWLKLDTDVTATCGYDDWVDPKWFEDNPAIVSQGWAYTKPPNQMMDLDAWVEDNWEELAHFCGTKPLNMQPSPGSDLLKHKRIISWCAFFNTDATQTCALMAEKACGLGRIPVPSQDGYFYYVAKRMGWGILTPNMKKLGWAQRLTDRSIKKTVAEAMEIK